MALSLGCQHNSRSRSSPSANLKSVPLCTLGLGLGLGRGWGHELGRIQLVKESVTPFVGNSLKPTRLAFNQNTGSFFFQKIKVF